MYKYLLDQYPRRLGMSLGIDLVPKKVCIELCLLRGGRNN